MSNITNGNQHLFENTILLSRPYDSRILIALGDTYHSLDKNEEAKKVLKLTEHSYTISIQDFMISLVAHKHTTKV